MLARYRATICVSRSDLGRRPRENGDQPPPLTFPVPLPPEPLPPERPEPEGPEPEPEPEGVPLDLLPEPDPLLVCDPDPWEALGAGGATARDPPPDDSLPEP
jgi:hypothetical protein